MLVLKLAFEIRVVSLDFPSEFAEVIFRFFLLSEQLFLLLLSSILSWTCNCCAFWYFTRSNKILLKSAMISESFMKEEPKNMPFNVKENFFFFFFVNKRKNLEFSLPETAEKNTSDFIQGE